MFKTLKSEFALLTAGLMAVAPLIAICLGLVFMLSGG